MYIHARAADTVHTILSKSHISIEIVITGRFVQYCQYKNVYSIANIKMCTVLPIQKCTLAKSVKPNQFLLDLQHTVKPAALPDGARMKYRKLTFR